MKKIIFTGAVIAIALIACKSKKSASSELKSTNESASLDKQLNAVKMRFSDATKEELQNGKKIYTGQCTNCHEAKDLTVYSEPKLLEIVDDMAKKAEINASEKQALIRYAIGIRAISKQ
ncbi:MAG: hypothetical protein JSU07_10230 [Bacteroidetes bacterium]|nr:hypothetical protein [Bacteroidota bacterium]